MSRAVLLPNSAPTLKASAGAGGDWVSASFFLPPAAVSAGAAQGAYYASVSGSQ